MAADCYVISKTRDEAIECVMSELEMTVDEAIVIGVDPDARRELAERVFERLTWKGRIIGPDDPEYVSIPF